MRRIAVVVCLLLGLPACQFVFPQGREEAIEGTVREVGVAATELAPARGTSWPGDPDPGPAADCVTTYPDDLPERDYAFDGTVLSVQRGAYDQDAGATPITLQVGVHRVFAGDLGATVELHTWEFQPGEYDADDPDVVGARALFATGETLDVMGCGFTRPYSETEAEEWARVFSAG